MGLIAFWFSRSQQKLENKISEDRIESDREIAKENQREATLKEYAEKIGQLLLDGKLDAAKIDSNAHALARAYTLTALRNLDSNRIVILIRFLYEANLIVGEKSVIDLTGADLKHLDLSDYSFPNINLNGIKLEDIKFRRTKLEGAYFCNAELSLFNFDNAQIVSGKFMHAKIFGGRLAETNFSGADLTHAKIGSAFMIEANFQNANLEETDFVTCNLQGAMFSGSNLYWTEFLNCNLEGIYFKDAKVKWVSVNASKVSRTAFSPEQIDQVHGFDKGE